MKRVLFLLSLFTFKVAHSQKFITANGQAVVDLKLDKLKERLSYLENVISKVPVPPLYSASTFTSLSDFTASDNFSVANGKIVATGDPTGTKNLYLNSAIVGLQNYHITVEYQVTADPTNSLGIRVNLSSINSIPTNRTYLGGYLTLAAGAAGGDTSGSFQQGKMVTSWNTTGTQYNNIQRGNAITYQLGDTIRHEQYLSQRLNGSGVLECYGAFRITNLRTGAINYYEQINDYNYGTTNYLHPNRSQLQIQCIGGTGATISKIEVATDYKQNRALVVGDSHTVGVFAGSYDGRIASILGAQADAGGSDKTTETFTDVTIRYQLRAASPDNYYSRYQRQNKQC